MTTIEFWAGDSPRITKKIGISRYKDFSRYYISVEAELRNMKTTSLVRQVRQGGVVLLQIDLRPNS
jgi:hypothetical protein